MDTSSDLNNNIEKLLYKCCIMNCPELFKKTLEKFNLYNEFCNPCIKKCLEICYIEGRLSIIEIIYDKFI